jgi:ribonuclease J
MTKAWEAEEGLYFAPLGGSSEIGMNLNLYGCRGKWLMVDLGATFAGETLPGIDLIFPDVTFIERRRKHLLAIILTHGHEDHIGAVASLWPKLRCPVYATPFTAALVTGKLAEFDLLHEVDLRVVREGASIRLDPFEVRYVPLAHSIAEGNGLLVSTPYGKVFHTGDWKLDPETSIAEPATEQALKDIGADGVLAMIGDSTNILNKKASGSEQSLKPSLTKLIADQTGRVVVTTFASNVERVETVAGIARACGRKLVTMGRSMKRVIAAAWATGYLKDLPPIISERDAGNLPRRQVLVLSTGCQGEPRSALNGLAEGANRDLDLERGDAVIFSSKIIPGNERPIATLVNKLAKRGVEVITEKDAFVHVSGHPGEPEVAEMIQWLRPKILIPVHGEARHIAAHASLGERLQVPNVFRVENGSVVKLGPGKPHLAGEVASGYLALDGHRLLSLSSHTLSERRRMMENGVFCVSIPFAGKGKLAGGPAIHAFGILDIEEDAELKRHVQELIVAEIETWRPANARDAENLEEELRLALLRLFRHETGKRPLVSVKVTGFEAKGRHA